MNKNPWLIAGTVASGLVALVSLRAAFPEIRKTKTRTASDSRSRGASRAVFSESSRPSKAWSGVTDTFGTMAASTAAVAASFSNTVSDTYSGNNSYSPSCDTSSATSSSCDTGSF